MRHRRTQDFTTEGVHVVGAGPEDLGDVPVCSRAKALVGTGFGRRSPPCRSWSKMWN